MQLCCVPFVRQGVGEDIVRPQGDQIDSLTLFWWLGVEGNCVCHFGRSWVWPCCWPILKPMKVGTWKCESNFVITSCACGCDLLMFLGFRVPSWVLGCLKN